MLLSPSDNIILQKEFGLKQQIVYTREKEMELIARAKTDIAFFAPVYEANYKAIFSFVYNRIRDKETVADLVQQTFLKAMVNLDKYQDKGFPFSSWLYRIAINEVNMYFRKGKVTEVEIQEKDAVELIHEISGNSDEQTIQRCLELMAQLPEEQSQLIEMRFFDKLSFQEIGQVYSITEANAKMRLYRILEKLKNDLKEFRNDA